MKNMKPYEAEVITPLVTKHPWPILAQDELENLKQGILEILDTVGVHFPLPKALEIFAAHGAQVDYDTEIVRIPPDLVERALSTVPRYFTLGGREPRYDFRLQERHSYFSTAGCCPFIVDLETREKRPAVKEDWAHLSRVLDYLKPVSFAWPLVSPSDHGETAPLHEAHAFYSNCRKHLQTETIMGETPARYAVEMALALSGDGETMRQRPPFSALICCIDPLGQDDHGLAAALVYAEAGLPVGFMAMNTMMTTGPATPAGNLVAAGAETISGLVLLQLAFPGTPGFASYVPASMDPYTSGYLEYPPLTPVMVGAAVELWHAWGVPALGLGGDSDAEELGWHFAKDDSGFVSALTGAEMVLSFGTTGAARTVYPEALILDCDRFNDSLHTAAGIQVTPETMALDVIRDVGPRGTFIMEDHTLEHMRQIPLSDLVMETRRKGRTSAEGIIETAREQYRWILDNHEPEPLEPKLQSELDRIVAAADREIKGT